MREQQADFVGVAGVRDVVELHDQEPFKSSRFKDSRLGNGTGS
jgi:hypothetical protein